MFGGLWLIAHHRLVHFLRLHVVELVQILLLIYLLLLIILWNVMFFLLFFIRTLNLFRSLLRQMLMMLNLDNLLVFLWRCQIILMRKVLCEFFLNGGLVFVWTFRVLSIFMGVNNIFARLKFVMELLILFTLGSKILVLMLVFLPGMSRFWVVTDHGGIHLLRFHVIELIKVLAWSVLFWLIENYFHVLQHMSVFIYETALY